ncbi:DUF2793 domain-containing protein [Alsobacter sp. SYSU M60028]|uniref:DUF2793 domain-containing protein n=1 Tax=Alsobacter ponti TaxID=2962936 RepID=A0ABT1LAI8_9HYPH|nr:DUF2793 domain-containing protein [Alsobacter ponti]MCP8937775.1 DUF2793 domain-containing protein [Alsobacter ponti]
MTDTTRLGLPYLAAAQSQKHVTHNEALQILDGLVQLAVIARDRAAPPDAPAEGDRYLIGASPTGAFAGQAGKLAAYDDGAWRFLTPRAGWVALVVSEGVLVVHDGSAWRDAGTCVRALPSVTALGVGVAPDAGNPIAAKLNAMFVTARGVGEGGSGNLRVTLNREGGANVVSHLYQSGWSGRAETGLGGDDCYRIKVSADGATWRDSFVADPATGAVNLPGGLADVGGGSIGGFRNQVVNGDFSVAQRGGGPFALAAAAVFGFDRWQIAQAGGATASFSRAGLGAGVTAQVGRYYGRFAVTVTTATALPELQTRLEDVTRLGGRTVSVSFWYRATAAGFRVELAQNFGSGGSAAVTGIQPTALAAASGWTRRAFSVALPSTSGKTVGAGSHTALRFVLGGASAATLDLADVQIEESPVATPFERRPFAVELLLCRRFFRRSATALSTADLAYEMRATPTQSGTGPYDYAAEL